MQWGRLFQKHCQTPPEFTKVVDRTIYLPWEDTDIRPANGLDDVSPSDYRIAVFDKVHNYSSGSGWGGSLIEFAESDCPVIALAGSVNEEIERRFRSANRPFPESFGYTHEEALEEGVIPDFEWTLRFPPVDSERSSTLESMKKTTAAFDLVTCEAGTLALDTSADAFVQLTPEQQAELWGSYHSETALSNALREAGTNGVAPEGYRDPAGGLAKRQTDWWNLRNDLT